MTVKVLNIYGVSDMGVEEFTCHPSPRGWDTYTSWILRGDGTVYCQPYGYDAEEEEFVPSCCPGEVGGFDKDMVLALMNGTYTVSPGPNGIRIAILKDVSLYTSVMKDTKGRIRLSLTAGGELSPHLHASRYMLARALLNDLAPRQVTHRVLAIA